MTEVTATKKQADGTERKVAINYEFGATLEDMIAKFGAETTQGAAQQHLRVMLQAGMRRAIEQGKKDEEIQQLFNDWKPGVQVLTGTRDPKQALLASWGSMSPEDRAEFIKALKAAQ